MPPPEMAEVPPNRSARSKTVTRAPRTAADKAAASAAAPEPPTTTSSLIRIASPVPKDVSGCLGHDAEAGHSAVEAGRARDVHHLVPADPERAQQQDVLADAVTESANDVVMQQAGRDEFGRQLAQQVLVPVAVGLQQRGPQVQQQLDVGRRLAEGAHVPVLEQLHLPVEHLPG